MAQTPEYQNVTVTVPVTRVGDLLAFAADLARSQDDGRDPVHATRSLSPVVVQMAYFGGKSEHWRPFIDVLVSRPEEWIGWVELPGRRGHRRSAWPALQAD